MRFGEIGVNLNRLLVFTFSFCGSCLFDEAVTSFDVFAGTGGAAASTQATERQQEHIGLDQRALWCLPGSHRNQYTTDSVRRN